MKFNLVFLTSLILLFLHIINKYIIIIIIAYRSTKYFKHLSVNMI